jgi:alkanesulfonate monooxygenase SsuD/methylene tetrahydromethanopterin reductase-like flavin-dependent oxidoreductase (luciferase family)/hemerythrin-like domain-containing protein
MPDYGHPLLFGAFVTPDARSYHQTVALARVADSLRLDILGVQDHPYQPNFLDTWTFLSALAAQTEHIAFFPDVANLPLRPPAILARSAATLDLLSGGRVELGLGSGAFPKGVHSLGGPARTPGEGVEALEEAIEIIRSLWTPGDPVSFAGKHYSLDRAKPGPVPLHRIGIFVGSYKPRMLRLTGRLADGWIPSAPYAAPDELAGLAAVIDAAAVDVGRAPDDVRRWYNVMGSFTSREGGFLQGGPAVWISQLAELAVVQGISGFILGPGAAAESDLRRFAEEVVPGVREAVAAARGVPESSVDDLQLDLPPSERTTGREPYLDESTRPRTQLHADATAAAAPGGAESAQFLVQVHNHLRSELEQVRGVVAEVASGATSPALARSLINRMAMRQNYWTLGAFCATYCRLVTTHHAIEDSNLFVDLVSRDAGLGPVIERLSEEHEVIAGVLTRLDEALVAMIEDAQQLGAVGSEVERLGDVLLSHLDYEEEELVPAITRLGIRI